MDNGIYILQTEEDLIAHEKVLYRNFYYTYLEYSRRFFTLINTKRIRPRMPYDSQIIYGVKNNGMLISAGSFCVDTTQTFEIEEMGFSIEKSDSVCEGLHFYSTIAESVGFNMSVYRKMLCFAFADILKRNINTVYSSCSEKVLKLYRYIGFEVVEDILLGNEREFLIKMQINQDFEKAGCLSTVIGCILLEIWCFFMFVL